MLLILICPADSDHAIAGELCGKRLNGPASRLGCSELNQGRGTITTKSASFNVWLEVTGLSKADAARELGVSEARIYEFARGESFAHRTAAEPDVITRLAMVAIAEGIPIPEDISGWCPHTRDRRVALALAAARKRLVPWGTED